MVDYRDGIQCTGDAGESVARRLGLSPGDVEARQCVVKAVVAAAMWARDGAAPSMARVEQAAIQARLELWEAARRTQGVLGDPAPLYFPC